MKKRFMAVLMTLVISWGLGSSVAFGEELFLSEPDISADLIEQEVIALRQARFNKMPYLDKALIRSEINAQRILAREAFVRNERKSLDGIIERAVSVYTQARAARERISLQKRRILGALRAMVPEASFELQEKEGNLSAAKFNSLSYRFNFRQPIFRGGSLYFTLLQEKATLEAAEKEYESVVQELVRDVVTAYIEYFRTLKIAEGQYEGIEKMRPFAEISRKKFEQEIVSEIEHLNVKSLFSQMEYDFETAKQELELAKLEVQKFLNLGIEDDLEIENLYGVEDLLAFQEALDDEDLSDENIYPFERGKIVPPLSNLVDLAYQNRADLQVEAARLESARLQERVRWGDLMPQIDAILEFGKLGEAFDQQSIAPSLRREFRFGVEVNWNALGNKVSYTFDNDERGPSVSQFQQGAGAQTTRNTLNFGVFDGLGEFAAVKDAEVSRLEQIVQLENQEKEVIKDVKQAFFDYQKSRIRVKSTLQRVAYRRRLAKLNKFKLDQNEIDISEYMQAEIDLTQELGTLHQALSDFYTAKASLNYAIGLRDYFPIEDMDGSTIGT